MRIHRILGRDLPDALRRARKAHGEDAMVVSRESRADGGVTLAVVEPKERKALLRASGLAGGARERADRDAPGLRDLRERMERHGASDGLVERVLSVVRRTRARGSYAIDGRALVNAQLDTLMRALEEISGGNKDIALILIADADASHQSVVTAMDAIGQSGFSRLSIATRKPEQDN